MVRAKKRKKRRRNILDFARSCLICWGWARLDKALFRSRPISDIDQ